MMYIVWTVLVVLALYGLSQIVNAWGDRRTYNRTGMWPETDRERQERIAREIEERDAARKARGER